MRINNSALMQNNLLGVSYKGKQNKNNIKNKNEQEQQAGYNLAVSKDARKNKLIENLNKQKSTIQELKEAYLKMARDKGLDDDEIELQLGIYEEQLASIDKKIAEIEASQRKEELEKLKKEQEEKKEKAEKEKTKEDIEKEEIKNTVDISLTLDGIRDNRQLKANLERDKTSLSIETKYDMSRGYSHIVKKKQAQLLDLEDKILKIEGKNFSSMGKVIKKINKNNQDKNNAEKEDINNTEDKDKKEKTNI